VTVQSQSGGGQSPVVPLTVATWPKTPGVYVQSILATRTAAGHATFAVSVANSAATDAAEVKIIAITVNDQPPLAPSALPLALGTIALRDRTTFSVIAPVASAGTLTLHVTGTAAGGVNWTSTLPVTVG